jgi:hypothetical protein
MAESAISTTRRSFLSAAPLAVACLSMPAMAAAPGSDVIAEFNRALDAADAEDASPDERFWALEEQMHDFEPQNERDFIRKFLAMWRDGGNPKPEMKERMIQTGLRLIGGLN